MLNVTGDHCCSIDSKSKNGEKRRERGGGREGGKGGQSEGGWGLVEEGEEKGEGREEVFSPVVYITKNLTKLSFPFL